ncbi:hypothetical protein Mapa_014071 [Marchantia paleacea]|nr:hypothetical protein Mapa_014071 [Marchantia paleacea]
MLCPNMAMARGVLRLYMLVAIALVPDFWLSLCASEEVVTCYHSGYRMEREQIMQSIDSFCFKYNGAYFYSGRRVHEIYANTISLPPKGHVDIYAEAINGCTWQMDLNNCRRLLLRPSKECNSARDPGNQTQGGYVTNSCLRFTLDPN